MGKVVAFRDPDAPLEGEERDRALVAYREAVKAVASVAIGRAFSMASRLPGCPGLGCEDVLPSFAAAMRAELAQVVSEG